ncbi:MAG: carbohydrate ABC transporter permease [Firmicutes bacterium]|nr:carbohydrate ABC transporter permease [Bacillota bacterium]
MISAMVYRRASQIVAVLFLVLVSIIFLFPIYWLVSSALKSTGRLWAIPPKLLPNLGLGHVWHIIAVNHLGVFFWHSLIESVASTIVVLVLATMMAYSLSRHRWKHRTGIANFILSLKIMPPIAVIIPLYLMFTTIGLYDTVPGMIIVYTLFNLPLATWLMLGFMRQIPMELDESARVEGASDWQVLRHIILPLIKASLVGIGAVCVMFAWNDYIFAVSLTNTHAVTLPVATEGFLGDYIYQWSSFYASGSLEIVPMVILALILQRYLIRGLSMGALNN